MLEKVSETRKQVANLLTIVRSKKAEELTDLDVKNLVKQTAELVFQDLFYRLTQIEAIQDEKVGDEIMKNMMNRIKKTQNKEEEK